MTLSGQAPPRFTPPALRRKNVVRFAYHAWLAPLAGLVAASLINACIIPDPDPATTTREIQIALGLVPLLALLACVGFGFFRSVQCLQGMRHPVHGIAGILTGLLVVLMVVSIFFMISDLRNHLANSPEHQVDLAVRDLRSGIPLRIDDAATITRAFASPPTTLNIEYEVDVYDRTLVDTASLAEIEASVRDNSAAADSPYRSILDSGADVHHRFLDRSGDLLVEFTVKRQPGDR